MSPRYDLPPRRVGRFVPVLSIGRLAAVLGAVAVLLVAGWLWAPRWGALARHPDAAGSAPGAASDAASSADSSVPNGAAPGAAGAQALPAGASGSSTATSTSAPAAAAHPDAPVAPSASGSTPSSRASEPSAGSALRPLASASVPAAAFRADGGGPAEAPSRPGPSPAAGPATAPPASPTAPRPAARDGADANAVRPPPAVAPPPSIPSAPSTPPVSSPPPATHDTETPPTNGDPSSDRTPPVLDGLSFDPPQVDDGSVTRLLVRVHDDLSGVRSVTGTIRSPSGSALFSFEAASADASGTLYTAAITIPAKAETGAWYVSYLYVPDRADNPLLASFTPATIPAGGSVQVISRESDTTPPAVHDIVVSDPSVQGGERAHLRVDVDDQASGVASVVGSFQSPSGAAYLSFICRLNAESGAWEGDIQVPPNADCGEWTVHQVLATDKAGNATVVQAPSPLIAQVFFRVMGGTCDATAPTLDAISLSPARVANDAPVEILVTASVSDAGTGAGSLTGWATGPVSTNGISPKILFACVPTNPADPSSPWTGRIMVPQYAAKGTWQIGRIRVQDRAQNIRDYTPADAVLAGATFQVE